MKIMREKRELERGNLQMWRNLKFSGLLRPFFYVMFMTVFLAGCTKNENLVDLDTDPLSVAGIEKVTPVNQTDSVAVNPLVRVTFEAGTDPAIVTASTLTVKKGDITIPVEKSVKGETAIFSPKTDLMPNTEYIATVKADMTSGTTQIGKHEYTWRFRTGKHHRATVPTVVSVVPLNSATAVLVNSAITVTFDQEMTSQMKNLTSVILKKGTSDVAGTLTFAGKTAIFKPTNSLSSNTVYSGQVRSRLESNDDDDDDENTEKTFNWSFTTGGAQGNDVTAPSVSSVLPANNATSVLTSGKYSVTFNEPMNPATITSATVVLKQGTVAVAGTVSYAGNTATFVPSAALAANTLYTGTVTTGVKDVAGNAMAANYSSGFTTASANDLTAPTVLSVIPLNNAVSVATNAKMTVTFSEAMSTSTINTATFLVKQGTTSVAGTVTYAANIATFTPSSALTANTVYTGNITTGAKDAAGNAIAANYSWTFTTQAIHGHSQQQAWQMLLLRTCLVQPRQQMPHRLLLTARQQLHSVKR